MRKALSRNPDVVLMLIAGYFLFAILSRVIRSPGLEVDESQQAVLSQFLLLGSSQGIDSRETAFRFDRVNQIYRVIYIASDFRFEIWIL